MVLGEPEAECPDFDDNLAEFMTENELQTLARDLMSELEGDITSRRDWVEMYVKGLEVLGMKYEPKAAGAPLVFEMRQIGVPVSEYTPVRGNDKFVRINSVADLFKSGKVWRPDTRWAEEVVEQMASFPNAEHDDLVDSSVQALIRFRQGGFLRLMTDENDETPIKQRKIYY